MKFRNSCFITASIFAFASAVQAQSTWNLTSGGSWNSAGNWSAGIPDSNTAIADLIQDFTGSPVVTLDNPAGFTTNRINYDDTGVTGDSTLEIRSGTGGILTLAGTTPTINVSALDPVAATLTISAELAGATSLTKIGAGTLLLAAPSNYTGATNVDGGTLQIGDGGTSGAFGAGTVNLNGSSTLLLNRADGGSMSADINFGVVSGDNTMRVVAGAWDINGGASNIDARNTTTWSVDAGATLNINVNGAGNNIGFGGTAMNLVLDGAGTGVMNRLIASGNAPGAVIKNGAGTWTFTAAYTGTNGWSTGGLTINDGVLAAGADDVIPWGTGKGDVTVNSPGILDLTDGSVNLNGLLGDGTVRITGATNRILTVGNGNVTATFSGALEDTGAGNLGLKKIGTGTLILTGSKSFAGSLDPTAGTLRVTSASAVGTNGTIGSNSTSTNTVFASADATALTFSRSFSTNTGGGAITFGDATGTGDLTFTGNLTRAGGSTNRSANVAGATTVTFNGNLLSPGTPTADTTFTKGGTGTLVIKGTGSGSDLGFSQVVVTRGTFAVTRLADLGVASSLSRAANATPGVVSITLDGGTLRYINGGAAASTTNRLLQIGRTTNGAIGTIRNDATNPAETVTFSNTDALAYGTVDQTRKLILGGSNTGTNTFASAIGENGTAAVSLTKEDAGTWALTGTNTYSGDTTVSAGILSLASAFLADASAVRITTGGTLDLPHGAEDTIAELWINEVQLSPGTYSAGNKPGLISGTGSLVVTSGPPAGSAYDSWLTAAGLSPGNPKTGPEESYDGSGVANIVQFALGGDVLDPAQNGIQNIFTKDAADADNLVLTLAVRSGATFVGSPSPSASWEGIIYTILGSTDLSTFTTGVEEVAVQNGGGSVIAPLGYTLKSFRLVQAPALSSKGFMRVQVTQP